jgi:hypothetical protein
MHMRRLLGADTADVEFALGILAAKLLAQAEAASGNRPNAAPLAVADLEDLGRRASGPPGCRRGSPRARTGSPRPSGPLPAACSPPCDALQQVERLEAGDDDRHAYFSAIGSYSQ